MKYARLSILVTVFVSLLGGWFVLDLKADSNSASRDVFESEHFSVHLPAGLQVFRPSVDDGQELFVFENSDGSEGFQVFTMPYAGELTPEALRQEIPDLVIDEVEDVTVGGEPALAFLSHDPDIGDTYEAWFVRDGLLYQVMTYSGLEGWLRPVLETWRFR